MTVSGVGLRMEKNMARILGGTSSKLSQGKPRVAGGGVISKSVNSLC